MKCEYCGKNDVAFYYRSWVNGRTEERRLCSACAAKLGYTVSAGIRPEPLADEDWLEEDWLDELLPAAGGSAWRVPFWTSELWPPYFSESLFREQTPLEEEAAVPGGRNGGPVEPSAGREPDVVWEEDARPVKEAASDRTAKKRRLSALRRELKQAAREENFERAAALRDQIRSLEQEQGRER